MLALSANLAADLATNLAFVDGLGFNPFFRGLLSVLTAVVVLIGGTYLVIATNNGARSGMLISLAGLFGWLFLMGIVWTIYGIGWRGNPPTWDLVEINVDDAADGDDGLLFSGVGDVAALVGGDNGIPADGLGALSFDAARLLDGLEDPAAATEALTGANTVEAVDDPDLAQQAALVASEDLDLGDWRYLVTSDPTRGEAQASVDAFLVEEGVFEVGGYVPQQFGAFVRDGKPVLTGDPKFVDRVWHTFDETVLHPFFRPEYIVMQVRGALDQPTLPGQPPPVAAVDPDAPLVSVIMERNRGGPIPALFSGRRFTPAMFTVFTGLVFALLAWNMHLRDKRETEIRAAAG